MEILKRRWWLAVAAVAVAAMAVLATVALPGRTPRQRHPAAWGRPRACCPETT